MQLFKNVVLTSVTTISFYAVKAQYTDTSSVNNKLNKSIDQPVNWNTVKEKKPITLKSFILPVALITYGVTTLKNDGPQSLNGKLKEEIWMDKPHKKTGIDNYLIYVPAAAVYGLNLAGIKGKNNFRDRSILFVMSQTITTATVFSVKKLSHEQRPDGSDYYSFPSGHTAAAFASAEFLRQEYKDVSPWYGVAGYAVATATGLLRIYNNKHWLSDVMAGAGVGIASTKLAYWIYPKIKRTFFKDKPMNTMVMPYYQSGTGGVSVVYNFH